MYMCWRLRVVRMCFRPSHLLSESLCVDSWTKSKNASLSRAYIEFEFSCESCSTSKWLCCSGRNIYRTTITMTPFSTLTNISMPKNHFTNAFILWHTHNMRIFYQMRNIFTHNQFACVFYHVHTTKNLVQTNKSRFAYISISRQHECDAKKIKIKKSEKKYNEHTTLNE